MDIIPQLCSKLQWYIIYTWSRGLCLDPCLHAWWEWWGSGVFAFLRCSCLAQLRHGISKTWVFSMGLHRQSRMVQQFHHCLSRNCPFVFLGRGRTPLPQDPSQNIFWLCYFMRCSWVRTMQQDKHDRSPHQYYLVTCMSWVVFSFAM